MSFKDADWYKDMKDTKTPFPRCIYCDEMLNIDTLTIDHIIPQAKGGKDTEENCKPSCQACNGLKSDMNYSDFITLYPKERILNLKKSANVNKELDGIDFMEDISGLFKDIRGKMSVIIDKKNQLELISKQNKDVVDKINQEITYSNKSSASEGYNMFFKLREANRTLELSKNELNFISNYISNINDIDNIINNSLQSMNHKIIHAKYNKINRSLKDEIDIVQNVKVNSILNKENNKEYKFSKGNERHIKDQYNTLELYWNIVIKNNKRRVFECSDRK